MGIRHPRLVLAVVAALVYLVFLAGLEMTFRAVTYALDGPEIERAEFVDDEQFGWVHNARMREQRRLNRCGEEVRRLPSPHPLITKLPKFPHGRRVLFLGDSFTHGAQVSSGKAYYDVFEAVAGNRATVYAAPATVPGSNRWRYLRSESRILAPRRQPVLQIPVRPGNGGGPHLRPGAL